MIKLVQIINNTNSYISASFTTNDGDEIEIRRIERGEKEQNYTYELGDDEKVTILGTSDDVVEIRTPTKEAVASRGNNVYSLRVNQVNPDGIRFI